MVDNVHAESYDDCMKNCKESDKDCTHFTYSPLQTKRFRAALYQEGSGICELYSGPCVGAANPDCPTCWSAEKDCLFTYQLQCGADNCVIGKVIKSIRNTDLPTCLSKCNSLSSCNWFSHFSRTKICQLIGHKDSELQEEGKCTSGQRGCQGLGQIQCGIPKLCDGRPISEAYVSSAEKCLATCKGNQACKWFSFLSDRFKCIMFESCENPIDTDNVVSGQRRCNTPGTF